MAAKKTSSKPIVKVTTTVPVNEPLAPSVPDFFEKIGNKGILLCAGIISLITFFVFKDFILGKKAFLYKDIGSDTLNGVLPYFYHYADYIAKNGLPKWSFAEGMGQNIFGGFLRDPFELITFMAGKDSIPRIFIFIELSKLILSGIVFYLFLKKLKVSNFSATVGAMLLSFSGFMIIGACWYVFTFEALNIVLLLLSFELLFQKNKWLLFVFSIFLVCISMPFNLYIFGLFLAIYGAFRVLTSPEFTTKKLLLLYGKMLALGVAGMLLSGPFLLENIIYLLESPRGSGGNSYFAQLTSQPAFHITEKEQFGAFIMRFFSSDLLGSGTNYSINGVVQGGQIIGKNWGNFLEAPLTYCGILSMLLMSQIFSLVNKNVRKWYIALLVLWLIPTIFPYFRYAFWLFAGDYYRDYSFFLALVFIIFSIMAMDLILKTRKINIINLVITTIILLILISYPYFKDYQKFVGGKQLVDEAVSLFVKAFIIIYAVLFFMISKSKNINNLKYVIIVAVAFELIYLAGLSVNRRDIVMTRELKEKVGYNDYSKEAVAFIKQNEKAKFYRIDKSFGSGGAMHPSITDHKVHEYYSTSSYNSFAQLNYINYLRAYGIISKDNEYESRWAPGLINRPIPILESLNNVKYILCKGYSNPNWHFTYDSINKFGDVLILKNKFYLPFGYTYNSFLTQSDFDKLSVAQKELVSLTACVLKDEDVNKAGGLRQFQLKDTIPSQLFTLEFYKRSLNNLRQDSLNLTAFSENKIEGNASVSENKVMYLSFPNDKGWHLKVDGNETEKLFVSNGMTGVYLTKGSHSIELEYKLRFAGKGVFLSIVGILFCFGLFFFVRRAELKLTKITT